MVRALTLAALSLALLAAGQGRVGNTAQHPEQPKAKAEQRIEAPPQNAVAPVQRPPPPEPYNPPCERGDENRRSDLCAQWKAADAAAESAKWTQGTFWAALAGVAVAILTLLAAVAAALFARKAAVETEKGAKAAQDAVEATKEANLITLRAQVRERRAALKAAKIARRDREIADERAKAALATAKRNADAAVAHVKVVQDTAQLQARAYVGFWEVGIEHIRLPAQNDNGFAFRVRWKNTGTTPAQKCKVWMYMRAFPDAEAAKRFAFEFEPLPDDLSGIIAPGAIMDGPTAVLVQHQFRSGATIIAARVEYTDVFSDEVHVSEVKMMVASHATAEGGLTFVYTHAFPAKAT